MSVDTFVAHFAAQFDDTDASEFASNVAFKKLPEWSSLTALSIIAMVDEEYDVQLKGDDIRNANTIAELFAAVESKK